MKAVLSFPEGVEAIWLEGRASRAVGYGVHVYRFGPWLIDAGFRRARAQLLDWSGLDGARACLLTHHHEDHSGNAAALARRGLAVLAPPAVAARVSEEGALHFYQRVIWGAAEVGPLQPLGDEVVADGRRLMAVAAPGHSSDHFVYFEPERGLLFAGDLYLGRRVPVARMDEDVGELLASLRKARDLAPRVLFCAHRGRVDRPVEALSAKIDWLEDVVGRARELGARGLAAGEIARRVLGREGSIRWVTWGDYCKRNLIELALRAE